LNRIDRLHAILTHLQSKKKVTAKELSERFGLSLRTVYRDVKALEESGVPIIGEAGIGYSVMEGYRLPPVMFTQEEASAILLSSKLADRFTDSSVKKHVTSALYKIKAILRGHDKDYLEELNEAVAVSTHSNHTQTEDAAHLAQLQKALIDKRAVQIEYLSLYKEGPSKRLVEPIGLYYYSTGWHLIAWCRLRNDYRDFRINRISKLVLTDEPYTKKAYLSLQQYIRSSSKMELSEYVVLFKKDIARFVVDQKYLRGFVSEEVIGDKVRMTFLTSFPEYLARWLLTFTDGVIIESPESLKETMQKLIAELQTHYSKKLSLQEDLLT
jgi:predicted DNA-binding transcriptional regulator YafY